ncbi:MAG TPA: sugar MFS transporter [Panacibacter sp.]|nr:sugar MFS transporter [Panacibacter sp.]HNP42867.1 sugar MFS transporter [Panacibacter sp.]
MSNKNSYFVPLLMIGILFGVFGFAAWLNSILIPYFQITLELNDVQTTLVTFSFFIAYVVMALPSSWVLKKIGFKKGIVAGLIIMALGTLLFIPAAHSRAYWLFLCGLFLMGTGQALLQTAANPYVTILGPIESAGQRNSLMGVFNKVAGILSQRVLGPILLLNADSIMNSITKMTAAEKVVALNEMALRVINPYIIITIVLVLMAILMWVVKLPAVNEEESNAEAEGLNHSSIWLFPNLVLGVLALFCAEGTESITSYYIIPYGQSMGFATADAQVFVDYIIYAMLAGYFAGIILIPKYIKQSKALAACAFLGVIFSVGAIVSTGITSVLFVIAMGFCNALNWPCIWPLALTGVGRFTKTAAAFLIMAIAGDALFPVLYAQLNSIFGPHGGVFLLMALYITILLYAAVWHKKKAW